MDTGNKFLQHIIDYANSLSPDNSFGELEVSSLTRDLQELGFLEQEKTLELIEIPKIGMLKPGEFDISNKIFCNCDYIPDITYTDRAKPPNAGNVFCIDANIHGIHFYKRSVTKSAFIKRQPVIATTSPLLLDYCELTDVMFFGEDLSGTVGVKSNFSNVLFRNCRMRHIRLEKYVIGNEKSLGISYSPDTSDHAITYSSFKVKKSDPGLHVFKDVDFEYCEFENIDSVHISRTTFKDCKFLSCLLELESIEREEAEGSERDFVFTSCEFTGEKIDGKLFHRNHVDLGNAKFASSASGKWFQFETIDFSNCSFCDTEFKNCKFTDCIFPGAEKDPKEGEYWIKFSDCEFVNTEFQGRDLEDIEMREEYEWEGLEKSIRLIFDKCYFRENQTNSTFVRAKFEGGNLGKREEKPSEKGKQIFENCILKESIVSSSIGGIEFQGCSLEDTNFYGEVKKKFREKGSIEWSMFLHFCKVDNCKFRKIVWPEAVKSGKTKYLSRVDFNNGTEFDNCDFHRIDFYKCDLNNMKLKDCHDSNQETITITESFIGKVKIDGEAKNTLLHMHLRNAELGPDLHKVFEKYNGEGLTGTASYKGTERHPLITPIAKGLMQDYGATSLSLVRRLHDLFEELGPLYVLKHKGPDLSQLGLSLSPEATRKSIKEYKQLINLAAEDNAKICELLSDRSYKEYEVKIKNLQSKMDECDKKVNSGSELPDEDVNNLVDAFYAWRAHIVIRISGSDPKHNGYKYLQDWLKGNKESVDFEITGLSEPGNSKIPKQINQKVYLDLHEFHILLEVLLNNATKWGGRAFADITFEEKNSILVIRLFDKGEGFHTKEDVTGFCNNHSSLFLEFSKKWCKSAKLTTTFNKDSQIEIDLRTEEFPQQKITDVRTNIGTEYEFKIELVK